MLTTPADEPSVVMLPLVAILQQYEENPTRSESAIKARKSMSTEFSNTSNSAEASVKVYRKAEITVALDAGFASRIRS